MPGIELSQRQLYEAISALKYAVECQRDRHDFGRFRLSEVFEVIDRMEQVFGAHNDDQNETTREDHEG